MITFFVDGQPRAKQSFRVSGKNGKGRGYTPAHIKTWQSNIGWAAQQAMRRIGILDPLEGNLTVELIFFLRDRRRVDNDNLAKAVQDGLNQITWIDDRQNIRLVIDKYIYRKRPGVLVRISPNKRRLEITEKQMEKLLS